MGNQIHLPLNKVYRYPKITSFDALSYFPIGIGAENIKEERDAKAVTKPLEPRRDDLNSSNGVESVTIKLDRTKHSPRNKSRNKIICVPSLKLNDLAIIDVTS